MDSRGCMSLDEFDDDQEDEDADSVIVEEDDSEDVEGDVFL